MTARTAISALSARQPDKVFHTLTVPEFIDLITVAAAYKADGRNTENAALIMRSHGALNREFKRGLDHGRREGYERGYNQALDDAESQADELIARMKGGAK